MRLLRYIVRFFHITIHPLIWYERYKNIPLFEASYSYISIQNRKYVARITSSIVTSIHSDNEFSMCCIYVSVWMCRQPKIQYMTFLQPYQPNSTNAIENSTPTNREWCVDNDILIDDNFSFFFCCKNKIHGIYIVQKDRQSTRRLCEMRHRVFFFCYTLIRAAHGNFFGFFLCGIETTFNFFTIAHSTERTCKERKAHIAHVGIPLGFLYRNIFWEIVSMGK